MNGVVHQNTSHRRILPQEYSNSKAATTTIEGDTAVVKTRTRTSNIIIMIQTKISHFQEILTRLPSHLCSNTSLEQDCDSSIESNSPRKGYLKKEVDVHDLESFLLKNPEVNQDHEDYARANIQSSLNNLSSASKVLVLIKTLFKNNHKRHQNIREGVLLLQRLLDSFSQIHEVHQKEPDLLGQESSMKHSIQDSSLLLPSNHEEDYSEENEEGSGSSMDYDDEEEEQEDYDNEDQKEGNDEEEEGSGFGVTFEDEDQNNNDNDIPLLYHEDDEKKGRNSARSSSSNTNYSTKSFSFFFSMMIILLVKMNIFH